MEQIGYSYIVNNNEILYWGDIPGQCSGVPNPIVLPNGDVVYCADVGPIGEGQIVQRWFAYGPSAITFNGDKVIVHRPQPVPQQVTPRQARLALLGAGLLDQVTAAVNGSDQATKITWEFATVIERDNPLILALATTLNLTSDQLDQLFITASTI